MVTFAQLLMVAGSGTLGWWCLRDVRRGSLENRITGGLVGLLGLALALESLLHLVGVWS